MTGEADETAPAATGMAIPVAPSEGGLERSAAHALVRGGRIPRHEAQLTQQIAAIARTDGRFASAFVRAVLDEAARDPDRHDAVRGLEPVPQRLACVAEHTLHDGHGRSLGRVDLRFDGDDFTLLVENKLHSGFGDQQLERYRSAIERLPAGRSGLVAITRNVPARSEVEVTSAGWLGAVRWARLKPALRALPVAEPGVATQWPLLLDVLEAQGDLGMTTVNADLVLAWAQYLEGRNLLKELMENIRERAELTVGTVLAEHYPDHGPRERLCVLLTHGSKGAVAVKTDQRFVRTEYRIPAREKNDAVLRLQFWMDQGLPYFGVHVRPWDAERREQKRETELTRAAVHLLKADFESVRGQWWSQHDLRPLLGDDDLPQRLLAIVEADVTTIAASNMLGADVRRSRRRLG